jgi:imidazolonepropionase-like amidohydrolase
MINRVTAGLTAALLASAAPMAASAQNLVVSNARIIVGNGQVIEKGTVVVRDGKIVSVGAAAAQAPAGATRIDGTGMTVMPGFIDVHRHLIQGDPAKWFAEAGPARMRELLEAGYTTVQSGGDQPAAVVELKKKVESGEIKGPRILAAGWTTIMASKTEDEVRSAVRAAKAGGSDSIAELIFPAAQNPYAPTDQERRNLAAAIDEGKKQNIPVQVHAVSPQAMMDAVRAGATKLIHTPHYGWLTDEQAKEVAAAGAQVSSCAGFGAPVFGVFNKDNKPTFRDGRPWPEGVLAGEGRGREAGYKPVNARTLFDNGVTLGYCTDTTYNAWAGLAQELKVLNLTFSPIDLVKVMGPNSAALIDRPDLGTLEPGKLGDLVVLAGNPLDGYWNFLNAVVVAKGGVVMVDKRPQLQTVKRLPAPDIPVQAPAPPRAPR